MQWALLSHLNLECSPHSGRVGSPLKRPTSKTNYLLAHHIHPYLSPFTFGAPVLPGSHLSVCLVFCLTVFPRNTCSLKNKRKWQFGFSVQLFSTVKRGFCGESAGFFKKSAWNFTARICAQKQEEVWMSPRPIPFCASLGVSHTEGYYNM